VIEQGLKAANETLSILMEHLVETFLKKRKQIKFEAERIPEEKRKKATKEKNGD